MTADDEQQGRAKLRRFMTEFVHSYEQLEVLLLLYRQSAESWSAEDVAKQLKIAPESAAGTLDTLQARGLLVARAGTVSTFRYGPESQALAASVAEFARAYADGPIVVIEFMSANAIDRVRSSALKTFAEAFRFRGRGKNG